MCCYTVNYKNFGRAVVLFRGVLGYKRLAASKMIFILLAASLL
jgi:hypothetical protein